VLDTEFIPEVVDDGGEPVPAGVEGELVITNLGRWGSPLIRYRTGDRVIADPEPCPCGRPWLRLKGGILGRTDDMMVIRGNNVYPSALENIVRRFRQVTEFQIELDEVGAMANLRLLIETQPEASGPELAAELAAAIRTELNVRPELVLAPAGSLPRSEMKARRLVRRLGGDARGPQA
jgi:phenylacetate-CoA ligase